MIIWAFMFRARHLAKRAPETVSVGKRQGETSFGFLAASGEESTITLRQAVRKYLKQPRTPLHEHTEEPGSFFRWAKLTFASAQFRKRNLRTAPSAVQLYAEPEARKLI